MLGEKRVHSIMVTNDILKDEINPFRIPENELGTLSLFRKHDGTVEQTKQNENKKNLKIWEKGRSGIMTTGKSRAAWIKSLLDEANEEHATQKTKESEPTRVSLIMERIEKYMNNKEKHQDKESLSDFISKKREMFLLEMSLGFKKDEIKKLDEEIRLKNEALRESEEALDNDARRFDVFLKENDGKAQEATRLAEKETKRKMEKIQEIKKLNQQLQQVQSTINKHKDGLEECLEHKDFLDKITPRDWYEEKKEEKKERQSERRKKRIEQRKHTWREEQQERIKAEQIKLQELRLKKRSQRRARRHQKVVSVPTLPDELPPEPSFEDEPLTSSDEESPMFFTKPQQLQKIFSNLEEENLFLIQNMQEAEQSLDEMTHRFQQKQHDVEKKMEGLQDNIKDIKVNIEKKKQDIAVATSSHEGKTNVIQKQEQDLMKYLSKKVKQIYQLCGFKDAGSTPSTLFMLSEIEAKTEDVLSIISTMPEEEFKRADKAKEKKRREFKRAQQQKIQEKIQEERNNKAIERSLQPPKKRVGRQVKL